jgi:hypothetical protein
MWYIVIKTIWIWVIYKYLNEQMAQQVLEFKEAQVNKQLSGILYKPKLCDLCRATSVGTQ